MPPFAPFNVRHNYDVKYTIMYLMLQAASAADPSSFLCKQQRYVSHGVLCLYAGLVSKGHVLAPV